MSGARPHFGPRGGGRTCRLAVSKRDDLVHSNDVSRGVELEFHVRQADVLLVSADHPCASLRGNRRQTLSLKLTSRYCLQVTARGRGGGCHGPLPAITSLRSHVHNV